MTLLNSLINPKINLSDCPGHLPDKAVVELVVPVVSITEG